MTPLSRQRFLKLLTGLSAGLAGLRGASAQSAARLGRQVYLDGELVDEAAASVSVFDHGFLYGDGVFEGIRAYDGRVFELEAHVERLYRSARSILLDVPISPAELSTAIRRTVKANGMTSAYIRPLVTRGVGNLGLNPRSSKRPGVIIVVGEVGMFPADRYETGIQLVTCATRRVSPAALSPQIKSMNYLNNIMAKIEANNAEADEGLMLNAEGLVAECTGENLFVVRDGGVVTPPTTAGALDGITRRVALQMAETLGIPGAVANLTTHDIYAADECFLTGTGAEIVPVAALDGRRIGDGRPGEVTRRLMERYAELTRATGVPIG